MSDWHTDWQDHTTTPDDGSGPITFWWDDMRPREVLKLIEEVYNRAYEQGFHDRLAPDLDLAYNSRYYPYDEDK